MANNLPCLYIIHISLLLFQIVQDLKQDMPSVWLYFKKSLSFCNSQKSTESFDPYKQNTKNPSMSNLTNAVVTNGDERVTENPRCCSSRSLESSKLISSMKCEGNTNISESSSDLLPGRCCSERFDIAGSDICGFEALSCHKCHERVRDLDAFEAHYLTNHSVTRLLAGDFSRTTVELICNRGGTKGHNISAILKVENLQRVVAEFEDYRELVKIRANKLSKKRSRCIADGNEFLGFHGTTISCSLGLSTSSKNLCFSDQCGVCRILRHGFSSKTGPGGIKGVFTASTSSRALENIEMDRGRSRDSLKALVLCRVVAGRVQKPKKNFEDPFGVCDFDSLALKIGPNSVVEDLYLLSTNALLPCFVIIFKNLETKHNM